MSFVPIWTLYFLPLLAISPFQFYLFYSGQHTKRMELFTNNCTGQALIVLFCFSHKCVLLYIQDKETEKEGKREKKASFKELLQVFATANLSHSTTFLQCNLLKHNKKEKESMRF